MNDKRITVMKEGTENHSGRYVLYWMQQSQRVQYNHALACAIESSHAMGCPLVVVFVLTDGYPDANLRHYRFMLEGIRETAIELERLGIPFAVRIGVPEEIIADLAKEARLLVMDEGYLKTQRQWRRTIITRLDETPGLAVHAVDTDLIVPVRVASDKTEYGAYTLRPKIRKLYQSFRDFKRLPKYHGGNFPIGSSHDPKDTEGLLQKITIDRAIKESPIYRGGYLEARRLLEDFINHKANDYERSNDPALELTSKMSMYLHFGQISALEILERMFKAQSEGLIDEGLSFDGYIEQLLVRRELAFNFVWYHEGYDTFESMTHPWAYETMDDHLEDFRPYLYERESLEQAKTHDPYWNAAMDEMRLTGYMHNYMRMYWAKKVIEWSLTYKEAFERIIWLNNTYFIDGRDPNSYTGVAWCFGRHDRPWTERQIFGKLRYMNDKGLERKFDIDAYVRRIEGLKAMHG